jgi:hypothetical protein
MVVLNHLTEMKTPLADLTEKEGVNVVPLFLQVGTDPLLTDNPLPEKLGTYHADCPMFLGWAV